MENFQTAGVIRAESVFQWHSDSQLAMMVLNPEIAVKCRTPDHKLFGLITSRILGKTRY